MIALAGTGPDLDGLSFVAGGERFYRYHHILFHNVGAALGVAVLAALFFRRRPRAALLIVFAFAMHVVEDYVTVGWDQYPWQPFSSSAVNLSHTLPVWLVQGVFQITAMMFILAMTVWIYLRYRRTPLEIVSPRLDRLIINYAVLPWRNRCAECNRSAHFRCESCAKTFCAAHGTVGTKLQVRCANCRS